MCVVVDEAASQDDIPLFPGQAGEGESDGGRGTIPQHLGFHGLTVALEEGTDAGDVHPVTGLEVELLQLAGDEGSMPQLTTLER